MKKLYTSVVVVLLLTSVVAQADAYYLYNIYPSYTHGNGNNKPYKMKQRIKIKGDNNVVSANQNSYQSQYQYQSYPYLYPQPIPVPVPVPQPQPQPQPQNHAPVWNQTSNQVVNVGQQLQFYVSAVDPNGDYLNYSANNLPSDATFNPYSRMFTWTPSNYQVGNYNVNFRVTDNEAYPVDMQVLVTVVGYQNPIPNPCYDYNYNCNPYPVPTPNLCYNQIYFTSQTPNTNAHEGQFYTYTIQAVSFGCTITYRLVTAPAGMQINQSTGVIIWVPNYNQGGQSHMIKVAASNGYTENTQLFYVYVTDVNLNPVSPVYTPPVFTPIYPPTYPPVYVPPEQPVEKLKITNVRIETLVNGDVVVKWETNKPSTSRAIFDVVSQANKTKDFTYSFATPDDTNLVNEHFVNLGQLEPSKTFYLRAVSKKGPEVAISNELTFVKLPCAVSNNCPVGGTVDDNTSNIWSNLNGLFFGNGLFWLMLLLIVVLAGALMRSYRQPVMVSRLQ